MIIEFRFPVANVVSLFSLLKCFVEFSPMQYFVVALILGCCKTSGNDLPLLNLLCCYNNVSLLQCFFFCNDV